MVAVVGDIHGCFNTFKALYDKVKVKYPNIDFYFVGDLVDRGNFSYETVRFFLENNLKFTPGNHDLMFYAYIKQPNSLLANAWVFNGSEPTLNSYLDHTTEIMQHVEFLKNAPFFYNLKDCFISHAGISSNYKFDIDLTSEDSVKNMSQVVLSDFESENSIIWTRDKLKNLGKLQVVGHTKQNDIRLDKTSNALYVDTGACVGRKLSCAIIESGELIDDIFEKTHSEDIK